MCILYVRIKMINNIQLLRALAVMMVVLYHSSGTLNTYDFDFVDNTAIDRWGAYGVDVFFIISGYIMAMIDHKKHKTPWQFAKDRIKRIVPLYWILTLAIVFLQLIIPNAFNTLTLSLNHVVSSMLFISGYANYEYPSLYVGWSLELEMLFYAIFSMCLFINKRNLRLAIICSIIWIFSIYSVMKPIAIEFTLGMVLYYAVIIVRKKIIVRWEVFPVSIVTYVLIASTVSINYGSSSLSRFIFVGVASMALVFIAVVCVDLNNKNIFTYIGDASYSIYLVQVFTIPFALRIANHLLNINGWGAIILSTAFTVLVGACCYELVERKATLMLKKLKGKLTKPA
ncbi:TPA: acyltransferase family protein [Klebsiella aerogenes]